jgi:hypothetical protein
MAMDNGTESRLVQANNGRLAGGVVDGHNVKTQRTFSDTALAKEVLRGMNQGFVFFLGAAQFRKRELAFHREASPIRPSISLLCYFTNIIVGRIFCGHGIDGLLPSLRLG